MRNLLAATAVVLAVIAALPSCSGCSTGRKGTTPTFAKADTIEVLNLAETYLNHVRDKEYDAAVSMLRVITDDSIKPLPESTELEIRKQQKMFPVLDYHLTAMKFVNEHRVRVTYAIEFFRKDPADRIQNTTAITFAPQRIGGRWYIELLDGKDRPKKKKTNGKNKEKI